MKPNSPRRFLIILPRQLGDILLGSSLAFALRETYPDSHIAWVAHPMGKQLLDGHPALDDILYHPVFRPDSHDSCLRNPVAWLKKRLRHIAAEITFLKRLVQLNRDTVIDVICTPRTALMTYATAARKRIGIRTRWNRNWAYNQLTNTRSWGSKYAAEARLELLTSLIEPSLCENPPMRWLGSWIPCNDSTALKVESWMREAKLDSGQFVLLSPTHRRSVRRWPITHYSELAAILVREFNQKIVWLWGPGERALVESAHNALIALEPKAMAMSIIPPLFSLPEVAKLSSQSSVWIGNSNGLSHVAMAGGARTIQIHGPTHSQPWTHPNPSMHTSVQRSEGCTRCEANFCSIKTHECMRELRVSEVIEKYKSLRMA